jgi:hypothetical protein
VFLRNIPELTEHIIHLKFGLIWVLVYVSGLNWEKVTKVISFLRYTGKAIIFTEINNTPQSANSLILVFDKMR